ncbi:MAG: iron-sulfur cluster assembly scaffold protein [Candidatus Micrarchaeaceae archaeon]
MPLDIYAEELINNYEHPDSKGTIEGASAIMHEENVSCGDTITIYLKIEGGVVKDAKFDGNGCIISMGVANMLMNYLKGKTLNYIEAFGKDDLFRLIGIDPGPARLHCATLSLRAAKKAVLDFENKPVDASTKQL